MNDKTIEFEALGLAQFMLHTQKRKLDYCLDLIHAPNADKIIFNLIKRVSSFVDPTPQALGVHVGSNLMANSTQSSLDVKHLPGKSSDFSCSKIKPIIKPDILYTHKNSIWIRCYIESTSHDIVSNYKIYNSYDNTIINYSVVDLGDSIFEIYVSKILPKNKNNTIIYNIINFLDEIDGFIIFCSELSAFQYSKLLFLSNYVKFMYCYQLNRKIFAPSSPKELETVSIYIISAISFFERTNLNSTSPSTHGPFIVQTGERPKAGFNRLGNKVYNNVGSRAMISVNRPSDLGATSTLVEVVVKLETLDSHVILNDIV